MQSFKRLFLLFLVSFFITSFPVAAAEKSQLNWKACLELTRNHNPLLVSARMEVKKAQADTGIAWSEVLPEISLYAQSGRGNDALGEGTNSHSYGVTGNQLLFDGLKSVHNIKAARLRATAAAYNYRVVSSEVRLNLRLAYLDLMKYQVEANLYDDIRKRRLDNYKLVNFRYESGREHLGSMLMAKANLGEAVFEAAEVKRNLVIAKKGLINAIGKKISIHDVSVNYKASSDTGLKRKPSFTALSKKSPLINQMMYLTEAGARDLQAAYSSFYPKISLSASAGKSGNNWPPKTNDWSVGLTVSYPLFTGLQNHYTTRQYKAELSNLKAQEENTKNSVLYALEYRWMQMRNTAAKLSVYEENLKAAEERAKIARAQYPLGIIDFNSWTLIEDALVAAKKNLLEGKINLLTAEAYWIKAYGGTLEYDVQK